MNKYSWTVHTAPSNPKLSKAYTIGARQPKKKYSRSVSEQTHEKWPY